MIRLFQLHRDADITGASGTGIVADGIEFADGTVTIRWRGDRPSTVTWGHIEDAMHVHGHGGHTRLVFLGYDGQPLADAAEPPSRTERGFATWYAGLDTYGRRIDVQQSSSAEQDAVWIYAGDGGAAHLDADVAVAVRDALNDWLNWLGHPGAWRPTNMTEEQG